MTKYKFEANERKQQRIINSRNRCEVCGKYFANERLQLSHIIPKHKAYLKKFGAEIIHHDYNLILACEKHNSSVMLNPNDNLGKLHLVTIMKMLNIPADDIRWSYVELK